MIALIARERELLNTQLKSTENSIGPTLVVVPSPCHNIRNSTRSTAKALCMISANFRWVITGTPIQNRLSDLASLLKFLQVYPYEDPQVFDTDITQLWKSGSDEEAIQRLKRLLTCIMLRRSKAAVELPERSDVLEYLDFDSNERAAYNSARLQTVETINAALTSGSSSAAAYRNSLQKINVLRMICNVGVAFQNSKLSAALPLQEDDVTTWDSCSAQEAFNNLLTAGLSTCTKCCIELGQIQDETCSEYSYQPQLTQCLQLLCGNCHITLTKLNAPHSLCEHVPPCPTRAISTMSSQSAPTGSGFLSSDNNFMMSTKMKALVADISSIAHDEKSLVFSFWTSTLDMIEVALSRASISFTRFDGQTSTQKRNKVIENFRSDPSVKVLLLTISCGAFGHAQALARIHRIGQTKPVTTVRFIIRNSFEEHVIKVQNQKKHLTDLLLSTKRTSESELAQSRLLVSNSALNTVVDTYSIF
ncbi:hypothetical protein AOQ84DRAFT_279690 [Glonium stellatum]|uniref:SNF2 N-terminal domain-containing protein n=1 Tax=Glonium stellatum TaxID=574774 RepID=A0A8E2FDB5_9PEZI|nr:hypothetical protein AOQ84DRAFT_279690 [Glonium stellatum]